jgi:hypothetical protein
MRESVEAPSVPDVVFIVWHRYDDDDAKWYRCGFAFNEREAKRQADVSKVATMCADVKVMRYAATDSKGRS